MSIAVSLPNRVFFGRNTFQKLGLVVKELNVNHLFVIGGSMLEKGPVLKQLKTTLKDFSFTIYIHNQGEPTTEHLKAALVERKKHHADGVVAIGGGSVIDLAKAVAVFSVHEEEDLDSLPTLAKIHRLPLIAVPTTAGTGSEATKVFVITDVETKVKKNPAHPKFLPDVAILDPLLHLSLPKNVTAYTGMDALAHALEAFVSTKANPLSDLYAKGALKLISEALPKVYENGADVESREKMLLGSFYAGLAFSNASTNLAHALARPLGAHFRMPHGLTVAILLPFVVEFGYEAAKERYNVVSKIFQCEEGNGAKQLIQQLEHFNERFSLWTDAVKYLIRDELTKVIPILVKDALSGNGIFTNHKIPNDTDMENIYRKLITKLQAYRLN